MKFISSSLNGEYLGKLNDESKGNTNSIKIAVAYASGDPEILKIHDDINLTFWGRYDSTIPISLPILNRFLSKKSPNYTCRLVPDIFHAKIIWWEEFGAYIGLANLTSRARYTNIEAGIFLTNDELISNCILIELNNFFDELNSVSTPLTMEIYDELCEINKNRTELKKQERIVHRSSKLL